MSVSTAGERGAGAVGEIGEALDAEHLARELGKQGRLLAIAGADLEHALGAAERERFDHPRDERRLRGHLLVRDRERSVDVCKSGVLGGHELPARHGRDPARTLSSFTPAARAAATSASMEASMRLCLPGR
jgi:hypothetical protein